MDRQTEETEYRLKHLVHTYLKATSTFLKQDRIRSSPNPPGMNKTLRMFVIYISLGSCIQRK